MTFIKVLLIAVLILWLISLIRVGARVRYGEAGLSVLVLAGPVKIGVLPAKPKKKKPKDKKKPGKEKKSEKEEEPKGKKPKPEDRPGTLSRLMQLLPVVGQACGALKRKIRIDELKLELVWGGSDPAAVALGYGRANAALGMLWPIFDNNFKVKRHSFQIGMDYERTQPAVELEAAATFTVGQIIALAAHYGVKALFIWVRSGRPVKKRQEAVNHE